MKRKVEMTRRRNGATAVSLRVGLSLVDNVKSGQQKNCKYYTNHCPAESEKAKTQLEISMSCTFVPLNCFILKRKYTYRDRKSKNS